MRYELRWGAAVVRAVTQVTETIRQFDIVPSRGTVSYSVGSHINLAVLVKEQIEHRSYSLVGEHAQDGAYRIAVKLLPDSRGGSRYLWGLEPGARLQVSNPQNLFELSANQRHYILIAGGIGITPILGMAQQLVARGTSFDLLYAARTRAELAFLAELESLAGPKLHTFVSEEGSRVDFSSAFSDLPDGSEVYLCGPIQMLEEARRIWGKLGRSATGFRFETFGSSGNFPREAFEVFVRDLDLRIHVQQEQTMLDALQTAGVQIMSDCLRGECGLCLVDVLQVEGIIDHRDVFLSPKQRLEGKQMCACVSRAVGGCIEIDSGFRPAPSAGNRSVIRATIQTPIEATIEEAQPVPHLPEMYRQEADK